MYAWCLKPTSLNKMERVAPTMQNHLTIKYIQHLVQFFSFLGGPVHPIAFKQQLTLVVSIHDVVVSRLLFLSKAGYGNNSDNEIVSTTSPS